MMIGNPMPINSNASSSPGFWSRSASYPVVNSIYLLSCVSSSGYVYCLGGNNASTDLSLAYYAMISSSGLSSWNSTTPYPIPVDFSSCVSSLGYVYCVGGYANVSVTNAVYYAQLSSAGIGQWASSVPYPIAVYGESCVTSGGYIYCIGGYNGGYTNKVYYAALSSNGVVGSWIQTTNYPINIAFESCNSGGGYMYCIAGANYSTTTPHNIDSVYYAQITSGGVGDWMQSASYPIAVSVERCVLFYVSLFCVGGNYNDQPSSFVYLTNVSSTGVGPWQQGASYPNGVYGQSCVGNSLEIYCIAGGNNFNDSTAVYFAQVLSQTETSVSCASASVTVNTPIICRAIVAGSNATGYVEWRSNETLTGNGNYSEFSSCTLSSGSCNVTFSPTTVGKILITANYTGDSSNAPSSGMTVLEVIGNINTSKHASYSTSSNFSHWTLAQNISLLILIGIAALVIISASLFIYAKKFRR